MQTSVPDEHVRPENVTIFECGPNKVCDHAMESYIDLYDENGRICGSTLVCSKCGETAFNISMWEAF